jgi:2-hydroxychromene-2-carboxylate isomerase
MTYEAARIGYQNTEQFARAMYDAAAENGVRIYELEVTIDTLRKMLAESAERETALHADAVRYRWLRDCDAVTAGTRALMVRTYGGVDLDREINEVMGSVGAKAPT